MRCRPEIVVGLNHSPAAREALRWAVGEANRLRADVTVVHAVDVTERADLAMERDIAAEARQCSGRVQQWAAESVTAMPPHCLWWWDNRRTLAWKGCPRNSRTASSVRCSALTAKEQLTWQRPTEAL